MKALRPPSFDLQRSIAIVRVGQLGALEKAVELLEHGIRQLFETTHTSKPVTSGRRRASATAPTVALIASARAQQGAPPVPQAAATASSPGAPAPEQALSAIAAELVFREGLVVGPDFVWAPR